MRIPERYSITELVEWNGYKDYKGTWISARPIGLSGLGLASRLTLAWKVLIGKYDAISWKEREYDGEPVRKKDSLNKGQF